MEVIPVDVGQKDQQMVDYGTISLKRSRSPSRLSSPSSLKSISTSAD